MCYIFIAMNYHTMRGDAARAHNGNKPEQIIYSGYSAELMAKKKADSVRQPL